MKHLVVNAQTGEETYVDISEEELPSAEMTPPSTEERLAALEAALLAQLLGGA